MTELDSRTATVRGGEAAIGDLFANAIRARTGADMALINGGGLRGNRLYPPGTEIKRRHILAELPFGNLALVLEILGSDLKAALEQGFAQAETLTGAFPQVSGMRVRADLSRPVGERVVAVAVNGRPLDDAARYKLATNDFLAKGGDGYSALGRATVLVGPTEAELVANEVIAYIAEKKTVSPTLEGRVIVARMKPAE
jgi:2',3'-cyclic-nucleotide 2'-phosphodiesterase (5'-nucleotidase family)